MPALLRSLVVAACLLYGGLAAVSAAFGDRLAFWPPARGLEPAENLVRLAADDGTALAVRRLRRQGAVFTIAYFHGGAEDLHAAEAKLRALSGRGFDVAALDYRGYGESGGSPTERLVRADAVRFYRYLVEEEGVVPERLILHGRSLGASIAAGLAATHRVGGLVLESAFVSGTRLFTRWRLLPVERFETQRDLLGSTCPVMILHGEQDPVAPLWHADVLAGTRPGTTLRTFARAGHDGLEIAGGKDYLDAINELARSVLAAGPTGGRS